jgi:hypothetical protein
MKHKLAYWLRQIAEWLSPENKRNTLEVKLTCDTSQFIDSLNAAQARVVALKVQARKAGILAKGSLKSA